MPVVTASATRSSSTTSISGWRTGMEDSERIGCGNEIGAVCGAMLLLRKGVIEGVADRLDEVREHGFFTRHDISIHRHARHNFVCTRRGADIILRKLHTALVIILAQRV